MVRFASIVAAAGALAACGPAWAAPEITLAAIATGRLYVVGTTDRPHMPVVLEDKFRTESDDKGKFQYELVYHPARCIVAATIDGKAVEAVVSNCGQQCTLAPPNAAAGAASATAPLPAMPGRAGLPAAAGPPTRAPRRTGRMLRRLRSARAPHRSPPHRLRPGRRPAQPGRSRSSGRRGRLSAPSRRRLRRPVPSSPRSRPASPGRRRVRPPTMPVRRSPTDRRTTWSRMQPDRGVHQGS